MKPLPCGTLKLVWGCFCALTLYIMSNGWQKYKRVKRYNTADGVHALTFSTYKSVSVLRSAVACCVLANAVAAAKAKYGFHLWAYVFMPDHVHMILWFPEPKHDISKTLQSIKQSASRSTINYFRNHEPDQLSALATGKSDKPFRVWQEGGGYDKNMTNAAAIHAYAEYIHENPVMAGLCQCAEEWPWSSARDWINGESGPISIDRDSFPVLE